MLRVERWQGKSLERYVADLAALRIRVFREYPYLYDGDEAYEARYLRTYMKSTGSVAVLVFDGERVVGASTGIPLADETPEVRAPFLAKGLNPDDFFYFGESVLLPEYRGHGLGVRFFEEREAHAREGGYPSVCFCAVVRDEHHPLRPAGYRSPERIWTKQGFTKHPDLVAYFSWRELNEEQETLKPMVFWLKGLQAISKTVPVEDDC
jgi:GNAT superfamily N-acetyltransferase